MALWVHGFCSTVSTYSNTSRATNLCLIIETYLKKPKLFKRKRDI